MENFGTYIDYIARTNLFNFVIFLSIIIFLIKKIDVTSKLEKEQETVKDTIVESETAKVNSEERLVSIEDSLANIQDEIDEIIDKSEENAKLIGERILQDAQKAAVLIKENADKALENSRVIVKNELLRRASLASMEVARNHIINELSWNQGLHDKLIDESLDALDIAQCIDMNEGVSERVNEGVN